jgi:outer membrane receptor protein involved in Fe transport
MLKGMPKLKAALTVCVSLSALSAPSYAQSADEEAGVDQIVVTAQRREQSGQDVPIALTALSGQDLADRGITNVKGVERVTPSLEIERTFGTGQPVFTLRGVGFDDYTANNAPTVGVYIDDIAYTAPVMTQGALFDLARVEVLRGPQGTLYGRNTTAGAINFVSNRATDEFEAGGNFEYARFGAISASGYVSGPVGPFRGRLAAITEQGGGFQRNRRTGDELGDADRFAGRFSIETGDEDDFYLRLNGHYYEDNSDGLGAYLLAPVVAGPPIGTIPADTNRRITDWSSSATFRTQTGVPVNSKPFRNNEGWGLNLFGSVNLGAADLVSITGYEKLDRQEFNDFDGTQANIAATLFNSKPRVFSQELRLISNGADDLNWIVGAYYSNERLSDDFRSDFVDSLGFTVSTTYRQKVRTAAVFGQADWRFADRFVATTGLRYEDEKRRLIGLTTSIPELAVPFATNVNRSVGLSEVSGKFALTFEATDNARLYASVSRGVKSGGFTTYNTLVPAQADPFRPEVLWSYEAGLKSELFDNTLRVNLGAFYYDYKDQQIQGFYIDPTFGAVGQIVNVEKSKIYGGEFELTWKPIANLTIAQSIGYKTGEFVKFRDVDLGASLAVGPPFAPVFIQRDGQDLPFPHLSYSGTASYVMPVGGFDLTALLDYSFRDDDDRSRLGSTIYNVDSYWLVNARLSLGKSDSDSWQAYVFGRNIFNEGYDLTRNFFLPQAQLGYTGEPATWGVGLTVNF